MNLFFTSVCLTTTFLPGAQAHRVGKSLSGDGRRLATGEPCLTLEVCKEMSREMDMVFYTGDYPTKGCFSKNGKAFFSFGTTEEMTTIDLPGDQERIRCEELVQVKVSSVDHDLDVCLTEEVCRDKSEDLGMYFYTGEYPTKGCFSKNGKVFFSLGTWEEMATIDLPGDQERIRCEEQIKISSVDQDLEMCLTEEVCRDKGQDLGMEFYVGDYPTKGCFSKNNKAFFSLGTDEEMSTIDLPGDQERIRCNGMVLDDQDMVISTSSTQTITPSASPIASKTVAPSDGPTKSHTTDPTRNPTADSLRPTEYPTSAPSKEPTRKPSADILDTIDSNNVVSPPKATSRRPTSTEPSITPTTHFSSGHYTIEPTGDEIGTVSKVVTDGDGIKNAGFMPCNLCIMTAFATVIVTGLVF